MKLKTIFETGFWVWFIYTVAVGVFLTLMYSTGALANELSVGAGVAQLSPNGPAVSLRYRVLSEKKVGLYFEGAAISGDVSAAFVDAGLYIRLDGKRRFHWFMGFGPNTDLMPYQRDRLHYHFGLNAKLGDRWSFEWGHRSTCSSFIAANTGKCLGLLPQGNDPNQGVDLFMLRYAFR